VVEVELTTGRLLQKSGYYSQRDTVEFCQEQSHLVTRLGHSGNVSDR
jgi:hypothetical protein